MRFLPDHGLFALRFVLRPDPRALVSRIGAGSRASRSVLPHARPIFASGTAAYCAGRGQRRPPLIIRALISKWRELFPGLAGREGKTAPQDQNPSPLPPDPMGRAGCSPLPPDPEAQVSTSPLPPDPHITGNVRTGDR